MKEFLQKSKHFYEKSNISPKKVNISGKKQTFISPKIEHFPKNATFCLCWKIKQLS